MSTTPHEPTLALRAHAVAVGYGTRLLREVELTVPAGEVTAIVGRTGSGKSTLLQVLGLLARPMGGNIWFRPLTKRRATDPVEWAYDKLSRRERNRILRDSYAYIFQRTELVDRWKTSTNIALPLLSRGLSRNRIAETVRRLSDHLQLDIEQLDGRSVARLSGGERQRVGIARALAQSPCIIFADEPFGGLDERTAEAVMDMFFNAVRAENITVVLVSHDQSAIQRCNSEYRINGTCLERVR